MKTQQTKEERENIKNKTFPMSQKHYICQVYFFPKDPTELMAQN